MVQHISENRRLLRRTFRFIQAAHKGVNRLRKNKGGSARSYDHHPMEVALLYAEMEVFKRRNTTRDMSPFVVADKIVEIIATASEMNKHELKQRLLKISEQLTHGELTIVVGLLCHDTIESSYDRDTDDAEKDRIISQRSGEICGIRNGAELIALRLTDCKSYKHKKEKRDGQLQLAEQLNYATLKQYDMLVNMYDEALIGNDKRNKHKKRSVLNHMRCFMRKAYRHNTVTLPFAIASERIYERAMAQLG